MQGGKLECNAMDSHMDLRFLPDQGADHLEHDILGSRAQCDCDSSPNLLSALEDWFCLACVQNPTRWVRIFVVHCRMCAAKAGTGINAPVRAKQAFRQTSEKRSTSVNVISELACKTRNHKIRQVYAKAIA